MRGKKSYICIILFAFGCEMLTPNSLNKHMISSWSINPDQRRDVIWVHKANVWISYRVFSLMFIRSRSHPVESPQISVCYKVLWLAELWFEKQFDLIFRNNVSRLMHSNRLPCLWHSYTYHTCSCQDHGSEFSIFFPCRSCNGGIHCNPIYHLCLGRSHQGCSVEVVCVKSNPSVSRKHSLIAHAYIIKVILSLP